MKRNDQFTYLKHYTYRNYAHFTNIFDLSENYQEYCVKPVLKRIP